MSQIRMAISVTYSNSGVTSGKKIRRDLKMVAILKISKYQTQLQFDISNEKIIRKRTGCVLGIWNCCIRRLCDVCAFSYSVYCVWMANKTATCRDPRYTCRDQLDIVLYVKKSRVYKICWEFGKYHIMCLSDMHVGDMWRSEPRNIESPRYVCLGSGIVAFCDFCLLHIPTVYLFWVGGERKPRHIGISNTSAGIT